ncbi:hypothetical protein [Kibdelosporangium phytohabitans]|uniref:Uncharacterized protein n=1 Tax=Kibdelosporangium phytohabitans TaxID=860235 RepID=A0A0N9HNX5_9PSEU|nr:hypothetical protein [Kibdelosporangium phytohabitans]ALG06193.1 hypothetical protein AOZ06_03970 [Kibdelosporangium phytohabitans]MBE1465709.1 hypothetical protein [Kibdelosporangium phytohabitans]
MPKGNYSNAARAALMALMLANRDVANTELTNDHKIRLGPADREALNDAGLLKTAMDTKPYVHRITDDGIDWCMNDLVYGEPPSNSGPLARMSAELLRRLVRHLQRRGTLANAIRSGDLELFIRAVYFDLAVKPQEWIRLARIRPMLDGEDKSDVDKALLKMMKEGKAYLAPDSNRKVLTEADHEAAVSVGGEDKHLIAIEES